MYLIIPRLQYVEKFLTVFASPSQTESITVEKFSNPVVSFSLGMRQKLQLENRQTAVQFWKHDHFHKDCPL
jgi:CHASE1-domain containing sensor protein